MSDDRQKLKIEVVFNVKHSPGNDSHLREILRNYFRGKGVPTQQTDDRDLFINLENSQDTCNHEYIPCPGEICTSDLHTHHCMHCGQHIFKHYDTR